MSDESPLQSYLKGLLYLNGIEVEKDEARGVEHMTAAAEAGLPEAMLHLANIYEGGSSDVEPDHDKATLWRGRFDELREEGLVDTRRKALEALDGLAKRLDDSGNRIGTSAIALEAYRVRRKILGEAHPDTLLSLCKLAASRNRVGHFAGAIKYYEQAWDLYCQTLGGDHPRALACLRNLIRTYKMFRDEDWAKDQVAELTRLYNQMWRRRYRA